MQHIYMQNVYHRYSFYKDILQKRSDKTALYIHLYIRNVVCGGSYCPRCCTWLANRRTKRSRPVILSCTPQYSARSQKERSIPKRPRGIPLSVSRSLALALSLARSLALSLSLSLALALALSFTLILPGVGSLAGHASGVDPAGSCARGCRCSGQGDCS